MKTAIWIYFFMFIAFFDLHAQFPILSPFALSLGAAPSFIGLIMGMYSLTHIPGNLLAGYGIDKYGGKWFIVVSLVCAGFLMLWQAQIHDPWQLLIIRSISGFIIAFLSPACLTILASLAKSKMQQGNLMSGKGLVQTVASVIAPAAGALLVAKLGFSISFYALGWLLIVLGLMAALVIDSKSIVNGPEHNELQSDTADSQKIRIPLVFYVLPLSISCSQGILYFELPLMQQNIDNLMSSGLLFSIISLGALLTLSLFFLNRYSPRKRIALGSLGLAIVFWSMSIEWPFSFSVSLFLIGMAKGIILPAIAADLAASNSRKQYGRVFAWLSISYSIGAFLGPVLSGQLREYISPYFIAFVVLMLALIILPKSNDKPDHPVPQTGMNTQINGSG